MPSRQPPADPPASSVLRQSYEQQHRHHHHIRRHLLPIAAGAAAGSAVALAVVALAVLLLYRRLARGGAAPTAPSPPPAKTSDGFAAPALRRFSYAQLRRATASFSPSLKLGQGGFGPVFRATIPSSSSSSSGDLLAVKVMDSGSLQGEREFQNELLLAASILPMPLSSASDDGGDAFDRRLVVPPIGYCFEEHEHRLPRRHCWWFLWWRRKPSAPADASPEILEASASSPAATPGRRMLLVYELMHNGSLQDALLDRRCPELMDWGQRFAVALDVARGLFFLHLVCDPPVIHGDIKPSNVLLDARFSAKIGDFGLARLKSIDDELPAEEEEVVIEIDADKEAVAKERKYMTAEGGGGGGGCVGEDDASIMGETADSTATTTGFEENGVSAPAERSLDEDESFVVASPTAVMTMPSPSDAGGGFDIASMDSGMDSTASRSGCQKKIGTLSGKDWWWRQDNAGTGQNSESGSSVKDYVMEWIRSEIKKERPRVDWNAASTSAQECLPKLPSNSGKAERKKAHRRLEWWSSLDEDKVKKKEKGRMPREWWREEYCEELTNKHMRRAMVKSKSSTEGGEEQQWWRKYDLASPSEERKGGKKKFLSRGSRSSLDWWTDGISGEFRTARRSSQDYASSGIPRSGTLSSTPSMRGTVCYVAPEYGGGGTLSEKCDIYSFGVLLLVIISGRRPLQVTASPMSEFERANLISWARQLARRGRLWDLVDSSLHGVDRDQALLCITVALLCLQRSPACRPSIKEVIEMLTGQCEPPQLPLEFTPSPPGRFLFKSRKKVR